MKKLAWGMMLLGAALHYSAAADFPAGGFSVDFRNNTSCKVGHYGKNLLYNPDLTSPKSDAVRPAGWGTNFTPRNSGRFSGSNGCGSLIADSNCRRSDFLQEITLEPTGKMRSFELKFRYRGNSSKITGALHATDKDGKELKLATRSFSAAPQSEWNFAQLIYQLPPEAVKIRVAFRNYGSGQADFKNASLREMFSEEAPLDAVLFPFAYLDNTYYIGENTIGMFKFVIRRADGKTERSGKLTLELPAELELLDVAQPAKVIAPGVIQTSGNAVEFFVRNRTLAAGKSVNIAYSYSNGKLQSPRRTAVVRAMQLPAAPQPKYFRSGAMTPTLMNYREKVVLPQWVELLKQTGFNNVCHSMTMADKKSGKLTQPVSKQGVELFHRNNIEVTTHSGALSNGYRFCGGKAPDDIRFIDNKGAAVPEGRYELLCPEAIINKHPFVMQVLANHRQLLQDTGIDAFEPNWEPFIFDWKGCFCERCLSAFEKSTNQPRSAAGTTNPAWVRFRSMQHGKIVRLVVAELGAKAFVPTIDAKELNKTNPSFYALASYKDYANVFERMVLWSPYVHYRFYGAYSYSPDMLEIIDQAAKAVQIPEKRYAYPNAVQVNTWYAEPETLAFQYLIYFFNRWHGASAYTFPAGLDMRWFAAIADANKVIAASEEMLQGSTPLPAIELKTITPIPDKKLLKTYRFKLKDGSEVLAIGNFWPRGESFCELPELPAGKVYKDVLLNKIHQSNIAQVGALKFRVYHIVSAADTKEVITDDFMKKLLQKRLPKISAAAEAERIWRDRDKINNNIEQRKLKNDSAQAELQNNVLKFSAAWGNAELALNAGGSLKKLVFNGQTVLDGGCITSFAHMGRKNSHLSINKRFFCTAMQFAGDHLAVQLQRRLQVDEHAQFESVVITLDYKFFFHKPQVEYTITLQNNGDGVRGPLPLMQKYFFTGDAWHFGDKIVTRKDYETAFPPMTTVKAYNKNKQQSTLTLKNLPDKLNYWNAPGAAKCCVEFAEKAALLRPGEKIKFTYKITP